MRIEPEQVKALVAKLDDWGVSVSGTMEQDLVDEFDVKRERPDENKRGGFRRTDPKTSKKAAFEATPRTGSQRRAALEAILARQPHGSTYEDVVRDTGNKGAWKRISELKQGGWIHPMGVRKVSTGSLADVYYPTYKARNWSQNA
jgi:hypothetical protein